MLKVPTVTIFVCAYNEEGIIESFLKSVLLQKDVNYSLKKIIVVSDGSTDKTVDIVKSFKSKKIELMSFKKRIGKSTRLNYIYKNLSTDILVQTDADVIFSDDLLVSKIIAPLIKNKKVALCGGNPTAVKASTFTENSINATHNMYRKFRVNLKKGNNVFSADGRLLALSQPFAHKLRIPHDMITNDMFAYFSCLKFGFEYRFVKDAIVWFRSPINLKDHIRQNSRFIAGPIRMEKYFNKKLVADERKIPAFLLLKSMIFEFVKQPVGCLYIFIVNLWCKYKAQKTESTMTAKWNMAISTKSF